MVNRTIACLVAVLALTAAHAQIVVNGQFDQGGYTYVDGWRLLPGGGFRMLRKAVPGDGHSLYLQLREDGDGGVAQTVLLPANRTLSLRMLATCWANGSDCALATLTRLSDGAVLAEVMVDGIERGELATNFDTGVGGPAELLVRLVGAAGARASIEHVEIGPPVSEACEIGGAVFSGADLVLRPGEGLRVDAHFTPRLLPTAAEMLQEAIEDATGRPTERVAGAVTVSVPQPETTDWPARESYHLSVGATGITIEAPAEQGAFWAMMTLIDLIRPEPSGGARILAVDVHDQPALPWRIGVDPDLIVSNNAVNGARRLARLKLNMAAVASRPDLTLEVADTVRAHGVQPVAYVIDFSGWEASYDPAAAVRDAVERWGAGYILLDQRSGSASDDRPAMQAALELSRGNAVEVIVYPYLPPGGPGSEERLSALRETLAGLPGEAIPVLEISSSRGPGSGELEIQPPPGMRYLVDGSAVLALRARQESDACLGAIFVGADLEAAANLAWRGLPGEVP